MRAQLTRVREETIGAARQSLVQAAMGRLEGLLLSKERQLDDQASELARTKTEVVALQTRAEAAEARTASVQAEADAQISQLRSREQELARELETERRTADERSRALTALEARSDEQLRKAEARAAELEAELERVRISEQDALGRLNVVDFARKRLESELAQATSGLDEMRKRVQALLGAKTDAEDALEHAQDEASREAKRARSAEDAAKRAERAGSDAKEAVKTLRVQLREREAAAEAMETELNLTRVDLARAESERWPAEWIARRAETNAEIAENRGRAGRALRRVRKVVLSPFRRSS